MAVYGYCRVSSVHQVEEGVSLDEQQWQLQGRAFERGWNFTKVFIEQGVSGGIPLGDRPEGQALLACLKPGDVILATKLDRMFRSALDALTVIKSLQARKVSLWLLDLGGDVSGNGIAELMLTVLAAVAQFERHRIGERIRDAKRHQHEAGQFLGGRRPPFGWRLNADGTLLIDDAEQDRLQAMREMRADGASYRDIGRAMRLNHGTVQRILTRDQP
jgi:DNA invertase Pin-like site-specific DNA recombinase